jgi:hypothetical protein
VTVVTPAKNAPIVGRDAARKSPRGDIARLCHNRIAAGSYRNEAPIRRDGPRDRGVACRPVTKFAVSVLTPAVANSVARERTVVKKTYGDGRPMSTC